MPRTAGPQGRPSLDPLDPAFDEAAYLDAWDDASATAVAILCAALDRHRGRPAPVDAVVEAATAVRWAIREDDPVGLLVVAANDWDRHDLPDDDETLVAWTAGALLIQEGDPGLDPEDEALVMTLEFGDWVGAVVEAVRGGVGTPMGPDDLVRLADRCPEVEGALDPDDAAVVARAFAIVLPTWRLAGVVDGRDRLSELGLWLLPRVLAFAWGGDFDAD